MARVTVEDCVLVVPNRFELCLIASNRAKSILSGAHSELEKSGEKPAVISLREIADNIIDVSAIRDNIISTIRNRGISVEAYNDNSVKNRSDEIISELQDNILETSFVSENVEVDD